MKVLLLCSLFATGLLAGCSDEAPHDHAAEAESHAAHVHAAPHGGDLHVLIEEGAHLELVHDAQTGELTAYVLGAHADTPLRVTQPSLSLGFPEHMGDHGFLLEAVANPLTGETVGDTSEFHVQDPMLVGLDIQLVVVDEIEVLGQTFTDLKLGESGN